MKVLIILHFIFIPIGYLFAQEKTSLPSSECYIEKAVSVTLQKVSAKSFVKRYMLKEDNDLEKRAYIFNKLINKSKDKLTDSLVYCLTCLTHSFSNADSDLLVLIYNCNNQFIEFEIFVNRKEEPSILKKAKLYKKTGSSIYCVYSIPSNQSFLTFKRK